MSKIKSSGWEVFYTIADVAGTPDTTRVAAAGGWAAGAWGSDDAGADAIDLHKIYGGGKYFDAEYIEFIFSVSGTGDGKTTVFELYNSNGPLGPRQAVCSLALTGGTAQVVAGAAGVTWCDTATATDYRGTSSITDIAGRNHKVIVNDSAANNVVSVTVPILSARYWEGLFTGAGSTATICTAYYRVF